MAWRPGACGQCGACSSTWHCLRLPQPQRPAGRLYGSLQVSHCSLSVSRPTDLVPFSILEEGKFIQPVCLHILTAQSLLWHALMLFSLQSKPSSLRGIITCCLTDYHDALIISFVVRLVSNMHVCTKPDSMRAAHDWLTAHVACLAKASDTCLPQQLCMHRL